MKGERTARAALVIVAAALAAASQGCSPSSWDVHAFTALAVRDTVNGARDAIREHHVDTIRAAALAVEPGDDPEATRARRLAALVEADRRWRDELRDVVAGQVAAAAASESYSRAALAALRGEAADADEILGYGIAAVRALIGLAEIARRHGLDLPEIEPWILETLGIEHDDGGNDGRQ